MDRRDPTPVDRRHVVLVGLMGAGKTTVGQLVAAELGRRFVDLDDAVEQAAGTTIAAMVASGDEAGFRRLEASTLALVVADDDPVVVSTGGGAVLDAHSRALLGGDPVVVWLCVDPATVAQRLDAHDIARRPLLDGDPVATLRRLADERGPLYAEVADVCIDAGADPGSVAASVVAALVADSDDVQTGPEL